MLKEIIWNNKFMCINGKPLFRNKVLKKGFLSVRDIMSDEGKLKSRSTLQHQNLRACVTPQNVITDTKCNSNAKCNNF